MEEITITRALTELKLLDTKINQKIATSNFVHLLSKKNRANLNPESLTQLSSASYQSITDLIKRRNRIKSAIILSNSVTRVTLNNTQLTVAEVIEQKQLVDFYRNLFAKLKEQRQDVLVQVERLNAQMELDLQKILEINFGKTSNAKTNSDDIENISKTYREHNRSEMIDGINVEQKIEELENLINIYETEANFVLSESNAVTRITV